MVSEFQISQRVSMSFIWTTTRSRLWNWRTWAATKTCTGTVTFTLQHHTYLTIPTFLHPEGFARISVKNYPVVFKKLHSQSAVPLRGNNMNCIDMPLKSCRITVSLCFFELHDSSQNSSLSPSSYIRWKLKKLSYLKLISLNSSFSQQTFWHVVVGIGVFSTLFLYYTPAFFHLLSTHL